MQINKRLWMAVSRRVDIAIVYGGGILGNGGEPEVIPDRADHTDAIERMTNRTYALVSLAMITGLSVMPMMDNAQAQRPKPIPAGDCRSMVAATGGKGIWYGEYSGRAQEETSDRFYPFSGRGCFTSEFACRRWTNDMATRANGWAPGVMRCRPYGETR